MQNVNENSAGGSTSVLFRPAGLHLQIRGKSNI